MSELVAGGNLPVPSGALSLRVAGPYDLSALVTGASGKVSGDADFVFFNQPSAPGVRLGGGALTVECHRLRPGADRVTVVVSPEEQGAALARLPLPVLYVTGAGGARVARFAPPRPAAGETVLLLAELYRRGTGWKLRALGQGYADGLAGVARDFGIEVLEEDEGEGAGGADGGAAGRGAGRGAPHAGGAGAGPGGRVQIPGAPGRPSPAPDGGRSGGVAALVNAERTASGARPLALDARLTAAAREHAAQMARQGRLSTESPDGTSVHQRVTAAGYAYLRIEENLVSGPRTPEEFVGYLLGSPDRRRPLCDAAYTDAGIGHAADARSGGLFWTALWAAPLTPAGLARTVTDVIGLTNDERGRAGLRPLAADPRLASAAQTHSADMAARGFYSHTTPEGTEPWDRAAAAGAAHRGIGENIACGQRTPAEVVLGWMNSPGHRANILKPDFTHIGIGFAGGGRAGTYWTQLFGASG
ncbi:CAP domain-containing protein [Streptomyces sp. NPDC050504]|uniref:CAP domain-containing protein n=1 Tax=Streptomyces sp. NPDC050504 TaxID=3365618 RepID=UPI00379F6FA6